MVHDQYWSYKDWDYDASFDSRKDTSIAPMCTHINFVIPDKFNGDQCKNFSILSAPNGDSRIARYA